jgi:hypothetical protein
MQEAHIINALTYLSDRKDGSVKVVKLNGVPHYTKRAFCPETGAPKPALIPMDVERIQEQTAEMEKAVAGLKALIDDAANAEERLSA